MSGKPLTLEAVKEQFCTEDKQAALQRTMDRLESEWDTQKTAELVLKIGKRMEEEIKAAGVSFGRVDRILWVVKEAFILGCLDMEEKMMIAADMVY